MGNEEKMFEDLLEQSEEEYREGNAARCLDVISLCLELNKTAPQWAINHFTLGVNRYTVGDAKTLDEAFEIRRPKGWHQNRARQRYRRGLVAHLTVRALVSSRGYRVDDAIAEVAERRSMSEADVERWYYDEQLIKELGYRKDFRRKSKKNEGD